ncbi:hypothetical protein AHAS_Ahas10G0000600 [Arachis hypogaea]
MDLTKMILLQLLLFRKQDTMFRLNFLVKRTILLGHRMNSSLLFQNLSRLEN